MATPVLLERQYSLDGYLFGSMSDEVVLLESGVDTGDVQVTDQDAPLGDSVLFGRDTMAPPVWTFNLGVRHATDVWPVVGRLAAAWRADLVRSVPGARSTLFYRHNGVTRVVYGRPRRFAVESPKRIQHEFRIVTAEFQVADAWAYAATERSLELSLIRTSTSSGVLFPVKFPLTFGSPPATRAGVVTVGGDVATPVAVTVTGPATGTASNFTVASTTGGWSIVLPVTLSPGQTVSVDTATGVTARNGVPTPVGVGRGSNLSARLQPGPQELSFTATDPSQTCAAVVSWRDATAALI